MNTTLTDKITMASIACLGLLSAAFTAAQLAEMLTRRS